ncbi:hypothetical protein PYCC9005_005966 [Savitreella phatthalungensis]
MKVLEQRSAFLSDLEVDGVLNELAARQEALVSQGASYSTALDSENLRTIQYELKEYLDKSPCSLYKIEQMRSLLQQLKQWPLTKVEKLMIINQLPNCRAELEPLVDELDTRFDDDQVEELLGIIISTLGKRPAGGDGDDGEVVSGTATDDTSMMDAETVTT